MCPTRSSAKPKALSAPKTPNKTTLKAMKDCENKKTKKVKTLRTLFKELGIDKVVKS